MGGFMQGQDWQHWEGSYEVADDGSHFVDWLAKLQARKDQKALEERLTMLEGGHEAEHAAENGGICGPTAIAAIALLPLGLYRLYKRRG